MPKEYKPVNDKTIADIQSANDEFYGDSTTKQRTLRKLENPNKYPHTAHLTSPGSGTVAAGSVEKHFTGGQKRAGQILARRVKKSGASLGEVSKAVTKGGEASEHDLPAQATHTSKGNIKVKPSVRYAESPGDWH